MDDILVPIFGIFFVFGLPIIALIVTRVLAHRERIEMIRQGMVPPGDARAFFKAQYGRRAARGFDPNDPGLDPVIAEVFSARRSLARGIRLTLIGLAIFIGLSFIDYSPHGGAFGGPEFHPGPWLLGGLIPMFVGISQIIIALLSGARFGMPSAGAPPPNAAQPYGRPWPPEQAQPSANRDAVSRFKPPIERGPPQT
jgi:hypothetical protein